MNRREEFLHTLENGLVSTEYSERFLQEMSDHLEDAEQLYALKENGEQSEEHAFRDIGDPKRSQKLFNHVMKYRNTISIVIECLLIAILAVPVSYVADSFSSIVPFISGGFGMLLLALCAQVALVTLFMIAALRRVQKITFGGVKLIYPAFAFLIGFLCTSLFTWTFVQAMQVDTATWQQVINDLIGATAGRVLGCVLGYALAVAAPWEKVSLWKKWQDYRMNHAVVFGPVVKIICGSALSIYPIVSTVLLWFGFDTKSQPMALALFQAPRMFVERIGLFSLLSILEFLGSRTAIIVFAFTLFAFAALLTWFIAKAYTSKSSVSSVQCAALVYIVCVLFFSPLLPPEPAKGMEWQVPVENVTQTQLHKEFGVLERFASYVKSYNEPVSYAIRYRPTYNELAIANDHPHHVMSISEIQNVHTYAYFPAVNQNRITDYAEDDTLAKGFTCDMAASGPMKPTRGDGAYCGSIFYHGQKIFTIPNGRLAYVQRIVKDESGRYALILMRNDVTRMANNNVYLVELPQEAE